MCVPAFANKIIKSGNSKSGCCYDIPLDVQETISFKQHDCRLNANVCRRSGYAGLPHIRFHDLRHTFATLALQNGVDVKTVTSMLGHYDAGFTLRTYTHATRQKQDEAAQTMGSFMAQVM